MNNSTFNSQIDFKGNWFSEMLKYATINEPKDIDYMKGEKQLINRIKK